MAASAKSLDALRAIIHISGSLVFEEEVNLSQFKIDQDMRLRENQEWATGCEAAIADLRQIKRLASSVLGEVNGQNGSAGRSRSSDPHRNGRG